MKKQTLVVILTVAMLLLLLSAGNGNLLAGPPTPEKMTIMGNARNAFTYQGRLTDASGKPLNGQYNMTFQLWDALTNGNQVGNDILVNNVVVENGVFNAIIPVPDGTFNGQAFWLRIKVGDEWLEPRQEIMPVPYAMSLRPGTIISGTAIHTLQVVNTWSPGGIAVKGLNYAETGWAPGIVGETYSDEGCGIFGLFDNESATDGAGISGLSNATNGIGVDGWSKAPSGGFGVLGQTETPSGVGVAGTNLATTEAAYGVRGQSNSTGGVGVYGVAITTTGWTNGVMGDNYSTEGNGVVGTANATSGWVNGVYGISHSPDGNGIGGENRAGGIGVYAYATSGTALYAKSDSGWLIQAVGVNDADTKFYVSNDGNVYADGTFHTPAADFAEMLPAHSDLEPGDVLIIGLDSKLTRSTQPYQTAVVGVYSTQPGFLGGAADSADLTDQIPLAIVGIVPVKVSAENGPIYPGDLLTPSATPGYAMVCQNRLDCVGAIIGKALEPLEEGTGMITVLITLQ